MRELVQGARQHPGREPSDPAPVEFSADEQSTKAQVATFRTGRYQVGVPAAVLVALITAASGFGIAWANKPSAGPGLTQEQSDKLDRCAALGPQLEAYHQENAQFRNWIEPQIGVILVRLGAQPYAPPPAQPVAPR